MQKSIRNSTMSLLDFQKAIEQGALASAKALHGLLGDTKWNHFGRAWCPICSVCCCHGHLDMAMWLFGLHDFGSDKCGHDDGFRHASASDYLPMVQWLHRMVVSHLRGTAFRDACKEGLTRTDKWLSKSGIVHVVIQLSEDDFGSACQQDQLKHAMWLFVESEKGHAWGDDDLSNILWLAFWKACGSGRMGTAMWLFQLGGLTMHGALPVAYRDACIGGHLHTAKWLAGLAEAHHVDICGLHVFGFIKACGGPNKLPLVKWLVQSRGVDVHTDSDLALHEACIHDQYETARWLIGTDPHWPWPAQCVDLLTTWGPARDAWIKAVLAFCWKRNGAVS